MTMEKEDMLSSERTFNERVKYAAANIDTLSNLEIRHLYEEIIMDKMKKRILRRASNIMRKELKEGKKDKKQHLKDEIAKLKQKLSNE